MHTNKVLYDNGFMRLEYDASQECLYYIWENFTRTEEYKATLETLQNLVAELQPSKLLIDQRKRKILSREASEWFIKDWFPKFATVLPAQIKVAFVEAEDLFGKITSHDAITKLGKMYQAKYSLEYKYFDSYENATDWLHIS